MAHTCRAPARAAAAALLALMAASPGAALGFPTELFGFRQTAQSDVGTFPQWLRVLERQLRDDLRDGDCAEQRINRCHMKQWLAFLAATRSLPAREQLLAVNRYANEKDYVLDLENYGIDDYWAIPREFLALGGDCEDYAITKYFSLAWLGYAREEMRIVVVQDTNLRVPHAVLAIGREGGALILDNQVREVLPDAKVVHYSPVYSINERSWWIHTPR
jgi:predicted transglutaminase-like cysteine proteinase